MMIFSPVTVSQVLFLLGVIPIISAWIYAEYLEYKKNSFSSKLLHEEMRGKVTMAKKRAFSASMSRLLSFVSRLFIVLSILLCLLAFLRLIHSQSKNQPPVFASPTRCPAIIHNNQFEGPSKVIFLFLARRDLPLDFLWNTFFKNGDTANFSIYIHSEPGFVF